MHGYQIDKDTIQEVLEEHDYDHDKAVAELKTKGIAEHEVNAFYQLYLK